MHATYIPFISSDGNSSSCCCSCYAHKMSAANVTGKQRGTNLETERTRFDSSFLFWKNHIHLAFSTQAYLSSDGDDKNNWQPTALTTFKSPSYSPLPSFPQNLRLQPSYLKQEEWIQCCTGDDLPDEANRLWHQCRFSNICKTWLTSGDTQTIRQEDCGLTCSRRKR